MSKNYKKIQDIGLNTLLGKRTWIQLIDSQVFDKVEVGETKYFQKTSFDPNYTPRTWVVFFNDIVIKLLKNILGTFNTDARSGTKVGIIWKTFIPNVTCS